MTGSTLYLDRLDSEEIHSSLKSKAWVFSTDDWETAEIEGNEFDFSFFIHLRDGIYGPKERDILYKVGKSLQWMDNLIVSSCIEEMKRTKLDKVNFENQLSVVEISQNQLVTLSYVGAVVNTEWEEQFSLDEGGNWKHLGNPHRN